MSYPKTSEMMSDVEGGNSKQTLLLQCRSLISKLHGEIGELTARNEESEQTIAKLQAQLGEYEYMIRSVRQESEILLADAHRERAMREEVEELFRQSESKPDSRVDEVMRGNRHLTKRVAELTAEIQQRDHIALEWQATMQTVNAKIIILDEENQQLYYENEQYLAVLERLKPRSANGEEMTDVSSWLNQILLEYMDERGNKERPILLGACRDDSDLLQQLKELNGVSTKNHVELLNIQSENIMLKDQLAEAGRVNNELQEISNSLRREEDYDRYARGEEETRDTSEIDYYKGIIQQQEETIRQLEHTAQIANCQDLELTRLNEVNEKLNQKLDECRCELNQLQDEVVYQFQREDERNKEDERRIVMVEGLTTKKEIERQQDEINSLHLKMEQLTSKIDEIHLRESFLDSRGSDRRINHLQMNDGRRAVDVSSLVGYLPEQRNTTTNESWSLESRNLSKILTEGPRKPTITIAGMPKKPVQKEKKATLKEKIVSRNQLRTDPSKSSSSLLASNKNTKSNNQSLSSSKINSKTAVVSDKQKPQQKKKKLNSSITSLILSPSNSHTLPESTKSIPKSSSFPSETFSGHNTQQSHNPSLSAMQEDTKQQRQLTTCTTTPVDMDFCKTRLNHTTISSKDNAVNIVNRFQNAVERLDYRLERINSDMKVSNNSRKTIRNE